MAQRIPFRIRSHEVSRVEAFSDVIFGFALSLIVISLEVPKTYDDLMETMRGLLPFSFCFLVFMSIWFAHHAFFRRYGLVDNVTTALNTALLFVILFYVYPMKFMFNLMALGLTGHRIGTTLHQARVLFTIYGLGYTAVNWLLGAMYYRAYRKRDHLQLNAVELIDTRESIYDNFFTGSFGIISTAMAFININFAGPLYFLLFIPKTLVPWIFGVKREKAENAMLAPESPGPGAPYQSPQHAHGSGSDGGGRRPEAVG